MELQIFVGITNLGALNPVWVLPWLLYIAEV